MTGNTFYDLSQTHVRQQFFIFSKLLGEQWKYLEDKEKTPFVEESKHLMRIHKRDHPDYHYKPRKKKVTLSTANTTLTDSVTP